MSEIAFDQLVQLAHNIEDFTFSDEHDIWSYIWGANKFESSKVYQHLIGRSGIHPIFGKIWQSNCQPKHIVFFWLILRDRAQYKESLEKKTYGAAYI